MLYKAGTVLFAGDSLHAEAAKDYVLRQGLTRDDVKIIGNESEVLVIAKKEVTLRE